MLIILSDTTYCCQTEKHYLPMNKYGKNLLFESKHNIFNTFHSFFFSNFKRFILSTFHPNLLVMN